VSHPLTPEEVQRTEDLYGPLTQTLRKLIDVAIRSEAEATDVTRAQALIQQAADLLSSHLDPQPFGVRTTTEGGLLTWGNVAIGMRNAIAPPLQVNHDENGRAVAELTLGAPYEGPPGQVHGGICALLLDHVLGATAHRPGQPAVTGSLTIRYLAPTPLGPLRVEAWIDREEGSKTFAVGRITNTDGLPSVQAEGVFIRPRVKT
jgi:acyl-coenzyme A thioesterase PaaI-like protein